MLNKPNEIRAIIMLVIDYIGDCPDTEYLQSAIICSNQIVATDYIDAFEGLKSDGLIDVKMQSTREICYITDKGNSILSELITFIPTGIREEILRNAWRYYEALESGIEYFSDISEGDGGYYLSVGVKVNSKTTCNAKIFFSTQKEALSAKKNCETRPQSVLNTIIAAVSGDINFIV